MTSENDIETTGTENGFDGNEVTRLVSYGTLDDSRIIYESNGSPHRKKKTKKKRNIKDIVRSSKIGDEQPGSGTK